jgi:hypothetical protein
VQLVDINVAPPNTTRVTIDGLQAGVTPLVYPLARREDHSIVINCPSGVTNTVLVHRRLRRSWLLKDLIAPGIGWLVDGLSGAWNDLEPDRIISPTPAGMPVTIPNPC